MKTLIKCLALIAGLVAGSASAFAADTWLPAFNPAQKVYEDPLMGPRVQLSNDFQMAIWNKGQEHGLDVYVVVAQRCDELATVPPAQWAETFTSRLLTAWKYAPGYQEKPIELIVYLRDTNSDAGSIYVHAGTDLYNYGVTGSVLASASGPVLPAARTYMRTDPQSGFLTIQDNLNALIVGGAATFLGLTAGAWILIIIVVVVLVILLAAASSGGGGGFFIVGGGGCSSGSSCSGGSSCGSGGGGDC